MKKVLLFLYLIFNIQLYFGQVKEDFTDIQKLNNFLVDEVNSIRKKAKVDSIKNSSALNSAAQDHAVFMVKKNKLTHYQKGNQQKYSPKNRADYYNSNFAIIGENVQQLHISQVYGELKNNKRIDDSYEALAKLLAENWRKSPPHYANMVNPSFLYTTTIVRVDDKGNIYACQLFGGSNYIESHPIKRKKPKYKPVKEKKCKRNSTEGSVKVDSVGNIFFVAKTKKESGFKWALPWTEGIAADIVLKSQYPCDGHNYFHPEPGIKGTPLQPVYKKDFKKIGSWKKNNVNIPLGTVPGYIDEPYEVNITIISRKRTCGNLSFNRLVSDVQIGLNLALKSKNISPYQLEITDTIITEKIYFEKSKVKSKDSLKIKRTNYLQTYQLDSTSLIGYASIEGDFKRNERLFKERTKNIKKKLVSYGFSDSLIDESARENYADFRADIKDSEFDEWATSTNEDLKRKVSQHSMSDSLESILANHRYVLINHFYSKKDSVLFTLQDLEIDFLNAIKTNNVDEAELAQLRLIQLLKTAEKKSTDHLYDSIPRNRQFIDLKYNFDLFLFEQQRKKNFSEAASQFIDSLSAIIAIDKKNRKAHTALAYFKTMKIIQYGTPKEMNEWFNGVAESRLIDKEFKSRLLLETAISNDLYIYYNQLSAPYLIKEASDYVRIAKPNVSETFGLSAYFNFFGYQEYAFDLIKRVYNDTDKPAELSYFLGLVLFADLGLNENKQLRYFAEVAKKYSPVFCQFFIDGSINFQVFDNLEMKRIYCKYCKEYE
jgi:uncharacterized protein YkwD